jgi:uncharacterized protein YjbJ (UPF0337 family)
MTDRQTSNRSRYSLQPMEKLYAGSIFYQHSSFKFPITAGSHVMNKHEVEGTIRNVAGKIEDAAGVLSGDTEHQVKGKARQFAGAAQAKAGEALDEAREFAADKPIGTVLVAAGVAFVLGMLFARRD